MPELYTKRYFRCDCGPEGEEFGVEHLLSEKPYIDQKSTWGSWYCHTCGYAWDGTYNHGEITMTKSKERQWRQVGALLRLNYDPQRDGPLHVIVPAMEFFRDGKWDKDGHQYFFEEHTCPGNIFRDTDSVYVGKDDDRHGLFEVVSIGEEDYPRDYAGKHSYADENFDSLIDKERGDVLS